MLSIQSQAKALQKAFSLLILPNSKLPITWPHYNSFTTFDPPSLHLFKFTCLLSFPITNTPKVLFHMSQGLTRPSTLVLLVSRPPTSAFSNPCFEIHSLSLLILLGEKQQQEQPDLYCIQWQLLFCNNRLQYLLISHEEPLAKEMKHK